MKTDHPHNFKLQKDSPKARCKEFFSPRKPAFWISNVLGVAALTTLTTLIVQRHRKRHKKISLSIDKIGEIRQVEIGRHILLKLNFSDKGGPSLRIITEERFRKLVNYDINGERLHLYCLPPRGPIREKPLIIAELTISSLAGLTLTGNAKVEAQGVNSVREFRLRQHGAEVKSLHVVAQQLYFSATGEYSNEICFEGNSFQSSMVGKGYCHLNVKAKDLIFRMAGESSCTVRGEVEALSGLLSATSELLGESLEMGRTELTLRDHSCSEFVRIKSGAVDIYDSAKLTLSAKPSSGVTTTLHDKAELYFTEALDPQE